MLRLGDIDLKSYFIHFLLTYTKHNKWLVWFCFLSFAWKSKLLYEHQNPQIWNMTWIKLMQSPHVAGSLEKNLLSILLLFKCNLTVFTRGKKTQAQWKTSARVIILRLCSGVPVETGETAFRLYHIVCWFLLWRHTSCEMVVTRPGLSDLDYEHIQVFIFCSVTWCRAG